MPKRVSRFVRISARGRWHDVTRETPTGAYATRCGRVLPRVAVEEVVRSATFPDGSCEKCVAALAA